ncbi:hypothetical protein AGMMS49965_20470 [Bacteroidia bacterium]|nr:hypothetical protein AGMMS49965_20470 [Bacteroidia bacterium]
MNCIFCHTISDNSKSVEHIIPESLGNKEHTLWKGAVCDKCNNYFAVKIEKEFLKQPYFTNLRFRNIIPTKKNKLVPQKFPSSNSKGYEEITFDINENGISFGFESEHSEIVSKIKEGKKKQLRILMIIEPEPNNYILSRFLAKCAFEYLTLVCDRGDSIDRKEIMDFLKEAQFNNIFNIIY